MQSPCSTMMTTPTSFWKNTRTWWCAHAAATDTRDTCRPAAPQRQRQMFVRTHKTKYDRCEKHVLWSNVRECLDGGSRFAASHFYTYGHFSWHFGSYKLPRGCSCESINRKWTWCLQSKTKTHKENVNYELKCSLYLKLFHLSNI